MAENQKNLKERTENFLALWSRFPIDYWWRKKYKVPFGSSLHREMSFIDMYIEYREDVIVNKIGDEEIDKDYDDIDLSSDKRTVDLTQGEIDKDFEELDLSQFNQE